FSAGASRRLGYGLNGRSWLLTEALPVKKEGRLRPIPMVGYYLKLVEAIDSLLSSVKACPSLPVTPEAEQYADDLWQRAGFGSADVWAINAGGAWLTKQWPVELAGGLATRVVESG